VSNLRSTADSIESSGMQGGRVGQMMFGIIQHETWIAFIDELNQWRRNGGGMIGKRGSGL
jgi:hypothetical protein